MIDPRDGHYFAGLVDGEGCFAIGRNGPSYTTPFFLHMRADDLPLLEWVRDTFGVGSIVIGRRYAENGSQPTRRLNVIRQDHCSRLVDVFREYPLRSKKRRDFEVWAEAVAAWRRQDWPRMAVLFQLIREVREYKAVALEIPKNPQLDLHDDFAYVELG